MKKILSISIVFLSIVSCTKEQDPKIDDTINDSIPITNILSNINFNSSLSYGSVSDIEGNSYKTIIIGNKTWMAENLRTKKFQNGDNIDSSDPINKNISYEISPIYQWAYNGDEDNVVNNGRLYSGHVAIDSRNICPTGWHVSSPEDWADLINSLDGATEIAKRNYGGDKIKETDTLHWKRVITDVTNSTGFTAIPAGYRTYDGKFLEKGEFGGWWNISSNGEYSKECVTDDSPSIIHTAVELTSSYSIRCVKD